MPKRKCCEHPVKHANSARAPKGIMAVSLQLSEFLVSRYNMIETRTRWLCPRCHAFESKEMTAYQEVQMNDDEVSSDDGDDDDAMMVEVLDNCGTNDEDHATEEQEQEQEDEKEQEDEEEQAEEDNAQMDSGYMNESKENYHDSLDMDEKSTDCESMDEEEGTVSYEQEYQKDEAVKQLSAVFQLLKIKPVHDKYVANLLLIF